MKTCKQRILAIMMTLLIAFAGLPATAFSASAAETGGTIGSVTWRLDTATNTVYIHTDGALKSGSIGMHDAAYKDWRTMFSGVEHIVLEEGVTALGKYALPSASRATLTLPNSLHTLEAGVLTDFGRVILLEGNPYFRYDDAGVLYTADGKTLLTVSGQNGSENWSYTVAPGTETIADSAFEYCNSLTSIVLPDSVRNIEHAAFLGCSKLSSVTFGDGLQTIGRYAFYMLRSLQSVQIPSSVTEIGSVAFYNMSALESITVSPDNTVYADADGVLMNKDKTVLIQFPGNYPQAEYTVPEGVKTIAEDAFSGAVRLRKLTLPQSLETVENSAFSSCKNLAEIVFPETMQSIAGYAFYGDAALREVILPEGITKVEARTFERMTSLERVHIPQSVTEIDDNQFFLTPDCTICAASAGGAAEAFALAHDLPFAVCGGHAEHVHQYEKLSGIVPTCTEDGEETYACACGAQYTLTIPALGHDWSNWVCADAQTHTRVCANDSTHTQSLEHQMEVYAENDATETQPASVTYRCADCGFTETRDVPVNVAKQEALQALQEAIDGLPDPQQLYYYTDEAILWVASALGQKNVRADEFICDARANGYQYVGEDEINDIVEATGKLLNLMQVGGDETTLNYRRITGDVVEFPNRDESKACVTLRTVPTAVNGEHVNGSEPLQLHAGDRVKFRLYVDTDYYVSSMILPILYDSDRFTPVDLHGTVYRPDATGHSDKDLVEITASPLIERNYDTDLLSIESFAKQYPPAYRTASFMARYKIAAVESICKSTRSSKVLRFDSARDGSLLTFTMQVNEDMLYGSDNACVGCVAAWYPEAADHGDLFFSVVRAAGYLDDGVTPASSFDNELNLIKDRTDMATAFNSADLYALFGQTCICEPTFCFELCTHAWKETERVEASATADSCIVYTCELCGGTKTETIARTKAQYTVVITTVDADGRETVTQQTLVGEIGEVITLNAADYAAQGCTVDAAKSVLTGEVKADGSLQLRVYIDRVEENIDPGLAATEEQLDALNAVIANELLDAEQLYYYTDEAILRVAHALGYATNDADAFIRDVLENGYAYKGAKSAIAVNRAIEDIRTLMKNDAADPATLNYVDAEAGCAEARYHAESKAHVTYTTVPLYVNDNAVDTASSAIELKAGDQVTFGFFLDTDYYLSNMSALIVYDSTLFNVVDLYGDVYDQDSIADMFSDEFLDSAVLRRDVFRQYDLEVLDVLSNPTGYPVWLQNNSEFTSRYKYFHVNLGTKFTKNSEVYKFDSQTNGHLFNFTLEAKDNMLYDGRTIAVGAREDWYCNAANRDLKQTASRAAGYLNNSGTPAGFYQNGELSKQRENASSACMLADTPFSRFGQSFTSVTEIGQPQCRHLNRIPGAVTKEATCTEPGEQIYICEACGEADTFPILPLGHAWNDGEVTADATCTAEGTVTYTCTRCGETDTGSIAPLGHDYAETVVEPTCLDGGYTLHKCSRCGDAYPSDETNPLGHDWDDGVMIREATAAAEGEMLYTCKRCGDTKTEPIPPVPVPAEGLLELVTVPRVRRGQTFEVTVQMQSNPGVAAMQLGLDYDPAVLELVIVRNESIFDDGELLTGPLDAVPFSVQWIVDGVGTPDVQNNVSTGALITFVFRVKTTAPVRRTQVAVTFDDDNVFDSRNQNVPFTVHNATFNIVTRRGDVNGDGKVDLKDLIILRRYLVGWDYAIDKEQADVNEDGKVNLKDVVALAEILVGGWEPADAQTQPDGIDDNSVTENDAG